MEPLTTALLAAMSAAAGSIAGGISEAAGGDAWDATRAKLATWAGLSETQARQHALERALKEARKALADSWGDQEQLRLTFGVLELGGPEARQFTQALVEELLLSDTPNIGRLLDLYRNKLRFTSALRNVVLPEWELIEPVLSVYFGEALPQALRKQATLRPLLLEQAQLQMLDELRSMNALAQEQTEILRRNEAMLREMLLQPRLQATITAGDNSTISNSPLNLLLGSYRALSHHTQADLKALYKRYREFLRGEYELLDFRGILQMQNVVKLHLEDIYVPLYGSETRTKRSRELQRADLVEQVQAPRIGTEIGRTTTTSLHDLIRDTPRLVILGAPGSGKSTLVKYVMLSLIRGQSWERLGLHSDWLPILFPVADYAREREQQPNLAPLTYVSNYYLGKSQPDFGELFTRALLSGQALVLFDGLDEVRDSPDRLEIVRRLETFVRAWDLPGNRFLATSRIAGYQEAPLDGNLFSQSQIQAFSHDDIRLFAKKWSAAYEQAGWGETASATELQRKAQQHLNDLVEAIFTNPHAAELAQNPLLLTMLALIRIDGVTLPNRRVELYQRVVRALAETWNRARSLSGRPIDVYLKRNRQNLDEGFVINMLGPAALWIHKANPGGIVSQTELENQLAKTFRSTYNLSKGDANDLARDFLSLVEEQTGLLQARGKDLYGFLHLTLEEYLAARALLDEREEKPDLLQTYATQAGWREVVRLCVASIREQRGAQRALDELINTPTSSEERGTPAVRAGECLFDLGPNGTTFQGRKRVIEALLVAISDPLVPTATRVEAGHILGRLGDPRLLDLATGEAVGYGDYGGVLSYWCDVEAGPFWFGDERVKDEQGKIQLNEDGTPRLDPAMLRQIELPYAFQIARYPVTNAEFAAFLAANGPAGYDPEKAWWTEQGQVFLKPGGHRYGDQEKHVRLPRHWDSPRFNSPAQPVVGVSWYEAAAYCRWLSELGHAKGWLPQDHVIRLPTSLEWERAARHTDQRPFPWGDTPPTSEQANTESSGVGASSPVGCFPADTAACGAFDVAGNVCEWTSTDYQPIQVIRPEEDFTTDQGVDNRGSPWGLGIEWMCCGARNGSIPDFMYNFLGFRVLRSRALIK